MVVEGSLEAYYICSNVNHHSISYDDNASIESINNNKPMRYSNIDDQLKIIRFKKHEEFRLSKPLNYADNTDNTINNDIEQKNIPSNVNTTQNANHTDFTNDAHPWSEKTILITGSSILNGLDEKRMNSNHKVK